jgi:hypothetical protein
VFHSTAKRECLRDFPKLTWVAEVREKKSAYPLNISFMMSYVFATDVMLKVERIRELFNFMIYTSIFMELIAFTLIEIPYIMLYYKYHFENIQPLTWFAQLYRGRNRELCEAVTVLNPVRGIVEHRKRWTHSVERLGEEEWLNVAWSCIYNIECIVRTRKLWNWMSYARFCCRFSLSTRESTINKIS